MLNKPVPSSLCAVALTVAVAAAWKRHKSKTFPVHCTSTMRDDLREFLLGDSGDDIASINTIEQAGEVFFGNSICLYGLSPRQFHGAGVRLCNRTVIECTNDRLARHTSLGVKSALLSAGIGRAVVVDIMCGSGNLMMHLMQELLAPLCLGFESNASVADCTQSSLAAVLRSTPFLSRCCVVSGDWAEQFPAMWQQQLAGAGCSPSDAVVVVVAPPWGDGFCFQRGLDLKKTHPPVDHLLQQLITTMLAVDASRRPLFACVQTHETMVEVCSPPTAARYIAFPSFVKSVWLYCLCLAFYSMCT